MAKDFTGINNPAISTATEMFVTPEKKMATFQKRELKTERLQIMITKSLYEEIRETAKANNLSMSEICSQLIEAGIRG